MVTDKTAVADIKYELNEPKKRYPFVAFTDTFAASIATTFNDACGKFTYSLVDEKSAVPTYVTIEDSSTDSTTKYLVVKSENTEKVGNHTLTITTTMDRYPTNTHKFSFWLNITEDAGDIVTGVDVIAGTAPYISGDGIKGTILLNLGDPWTYQFEVVDDDDDLESVKVRLGQASVFVKFDKDENSLTINANDPAQTICRWDLDISLEDSFKNIGNYPFTIEIVCPSPLVEDESGQCIDPASLEPEEPEPTEEETTTD